MDCTKFHELISAYTDNELNLAEENILFKHLRLCKFCKTEFNNITKIKNFIKNESIENYDIDFSKDIMNKIYSLEKEKGYDNKIRFINTHYIIKKSTFEQSSKAYSPITKGSIAVTVMVLIFFLIYNSWTLLSDDFNKNNLENLVLKHVDAISITEVNFPDIQKAAFEK